MLNLVPIFLYLLFGSNAKYLLVLAGLMLVLNYYVVYVVKLINDPIEKAIYKKFWRMAEDKLASYKDLKVIGITGSYGKTSSKNRQKSLKRTLRATGASGSRARGGSWRVSA